MGVFKAKLGASGFEITTEQRMTSDLGWVVRLSNGSIVNCYDSGAVSVQGKCQPEVKSALRLIGNGRAAAAAAVAIAPHSRAPEKVFVVYGHDEDARTKLEAMLRRWNMEPLILDQLASEGQTIIEKLEKYTS